MSREAAKRVGLFGGTFDPTHNGHLSVVRQALDVFELDEIILIPAARPPHKHFYTSFKHRAAMLRAAFENTDKVSISEIEAKRPGTSYTLDTVRELTRSTNQYFLIIGADTLLEIHLWYKYKLLLNEINLLVINRPGITTAMIENQISSLNNYSRAEDGCQWRHTTDGPSIYLLNQTESDVSSTTIRQHLQQKQTVDHLVPTAVAAYIQNHKLYGVC